LQLKEKELQLKMAEMQLQEKQMQLKEKQMNQQLTDQSKAQGKVKSNQAAMDPDSKEEVEVLDEGGRHSDMRLVTGDLDLAPIHGVMKGPMMSLKEALAPLIALFPVLAAFLHQAAKVGKKLSPGDPYGLTPDMCAVLWLYTCEGPFYTHVNALLRMADRQRCKILFPVLRSMLEAMGKLPKYTGVVWRGVQLTPEALAKAKTTVPVLIADLKQKMKDEEELIWWSFSSCSLSMDTAIHFAGGTTAKDVKLIFSIQASTGVSIKAYSSIPDEVEVLLPAGTSFLIKNVGEVSPGTWVIQLLEIESPVPLVS
jgi:hypothetical protein